MKVYHVNSFLLAILLFFPFTLESQNMLIKNYDVGLFVLNKNKYENNYRNFIDSLNKLSFDSVVVKMKDRIKYEPSSTLGLPDGSINYEDIYEFDVNMQQLFAREFVALCESFIDLPSIPLDSNGMENFFEKLLFYQCGEFFTGYFFYNQIYYPPANFQSLFREFHIETNRHSEMVKLINPFYPYFEDPEGINQIYHYVLDRELCFLIYNKVLLLKNLQIEDQMLTKNIIYLEHIFMRAANDELLIIIQTSA